MRLVFFGLSLTSSWGNGHATTYRGLLSGLQRRGHEVTFFEKDADWYARHRDLPQPPQARLQLYQHWAEIRPAALRAAGEADAVIVGSYFPDAIPLLDDLLARGTALTCFYDIDTPVTLAELRTGRCRYLRADQIAALDLYLSFTGGPVLEELQRLWQARCVRPLYCACDESEYRRAQRPLRPPVALSFLGTYAADRQAKFERLLLEPARRSPGQQFHVAGSMYPQPELWPANVEYQSHLAPGRHAEFYAASRFTLNLTRQAMVEAGYSPSIRLFEAAAAATPIISDPWPGLAGFLEPGREILLASSSSETQAILDNITVAEAAALGRAAQEHVLATHTCGQRAQELETYLTAAAAHSTPLRC